MQYPDLDLLPHACSLGSRRVLVPGRRMEIIGASVMNGFGNLGLTQGCSDLAAVPPPRFIPHGMHACLLPCNAHACISRSGLAECSKSPSSGMRCCQVRIAAARRLPVRAQAQDSLLAVGPLTATHFGARFTQLAWTGAGILTPGAAPQQTQQQQGQVASLPLISTRCCRRTPTLSGALKAV